MTKPTLADLERVYRKLSINNPWTDDVMQPEPTGPQSGILVYAAPISPPSITGIYGIALADEPGTVAAKTYTSIFNPVGSTRLILLVQVNVSKYTSGAGTSTSMLFNRTSAASGGTLESTEIFKADTTNRDTIAEVRTGNPTVVPTDQLVVSMAPPISTGGGSSVIESLTTGATGTFILRPGEGIATRILTGSTNHFWNISQIWAEVDIA